MAEVLILPYVSTEIPIGKVFDINNIEYTYQIEYNELYDFYTMTIKNQDDEIIYTTKLVYGNDALHAISTASAIGKKIIPYTLKEKILNYNQDSFDKVSLYVVD